MPEYTPVQSWLGQTFIMQANDQDSFFPVAIVPAHLCVPEYQKDFKLRKKKQREGCGISTGTENLKIEEIYPANKADNNTDKKLCFMIALINWCEC